MLKQKIILLSLLLFLVSTNIIFPAQLSDNLLSALYNANNQDQIDVLIIMSNQLDLSNTEAVFKLRSASRHARHKIMIDQLQDLSENNQHELKTILAEGVISGEVFSWESYWISNAFYVEASKRFILSLEDRSDIELIVKNEPMQSLRFDQKSGMTPSLSGADLGLGVPIGLEVIGADSMWELGYTGEGTLIASFDTGIDGTHPALSGSWRGNNGYSSAESWFDPIDQASTPSWGGSVFSSQHHGTNTMGILVGKDDATGDTTGVAWGAQWISAKVINVSGANFISAFQWAADPDGDPNTSDDVPDVLNNSWGFTQDILGCNNLFWSSIDNLEALGTVCVFAGGNSGSSAMSMTNPANRATNEFNTFSVGNIDPHNPLYPIWFSSSRGPSDCDGVTIKPEVVAPGRNIRSTRPLQVGSDGYVDDLTGTSMATPYVAGAVALLRQYNPNASVTEIKTALMNSATDLGTAGEDNTYGYGLINIPAALQLMPTNSDVNIYVKSVSNPTITDGDTVEVVVTLKNSGAGAVNVSGELSNADSEISILEGFSSFASSLPMGSIADNSTDPFQLVFDNGLREGELLSATFEITANGSSYSNIVKIYFRVGSKQEKSIFTHISDSLKFTVSNYGSYGLASGSAFENGGIGFRYPANSPNNGLYQCGLMIGTSADQVSDGIVHHIGWVDQDFAVAPDGNLLNFTNGDLGDIETFSRMNDNNSINPIGITIEQRTASFTSAPNSNYIIMEFVISNSSEETINGIYTGLFFDWDFPTGGFGYDRSGFDQSLDLGYMWDNTSPDYRGTAVLNSQGATSYIAFKNADQYCETCDGVTEADKYDFLTAGLSWTPVDSTYDQAMVIATGPFNLSPGEQDTATFAIIAATNLLDLKALTQTAYQTYREFTPVVEDDSHQLPKGYALLQNYPNPFNPETQISFSLAKSDRVTIDVFNILGQKIVTLLDQEKNVGHHTIFWNGKDYSGEQVASGVYFYRLKSGDFSDIKKMLLMK